MRVPRKVKKATFDKKNRQFRDDWFRDAKSRGMRLTDIILATGWSKVTVEKAVYGSKYDGIEKVEEVKPVMDEGINSKPMWRKGDVIEERELSSGEVVLCNISRFERVKRFIQGLKLASKTGEPINFIMSDFQHDVLFDAYAPIRGMDDKRRSKTRSVLSCGRQNGKSQLTAAIIVTHLVGPESIPHSTIVCAASTVEQAGVVFDYVAKMLQFSGLAGKVKIADHLKTINATDMTRPVEFKVVSKNDRSAQGLPNVLFVADEVAQYLNDKLLSALSSAQGKYDEPMGFMISTMSDVPNNPMTEMVRYSELASFGKPDFDPRWNFHIHTADPQCDLDDEEQWRNANPNLGLSPSYDDMRDSCKLASTVLSKEAHFRTYRLNQSVGSSASLLDWTRWKLNADTDLTAESLEGKRCYAGLDLSRTTDLTSLSLYFPTEGCFVTWSWMPEGRIDDLTYIDRVPYHTFINDGWLESCEGDAIDYAVIARRVSEICSKYRVACLGYDKQYMDSVQYVIRAERLKMPRMKQFFQSGSWMNSGITEFEGMIARGELRHRDSPLETRAASQLEVKRTPNGGLKIDKTRPTDRIDPLVATIFAVGTAVNAGRPERKVVESNKSESYEPGVDDDGYPTRMY